MRISLKVKEVFEVYTTEATCSNCSPEELTPVLAMSSETHATYGCLKCGVITDPELL